MPREKKIQVRLSDQEYDTLMEYAKSKGVPAAEVLRDYVKTLGKGKK